MLMMLLTFFVVYEVIRAFVIGKIQKMRRSIIEKLFGRATTPQAPPMPPPVPPSAPQAARPSGPVATGVRRPAMMVLRCRRAVKSSYFI